MDDEALHNLEKVLAARRATMIRATILDRDSQPLAIGLATPPTEGEGIRGVFWPDDPRQWDTLAPLAAMLHRLDEPALKFVRFEQCTADLAGSPHFHFETEA